MAQEKGPAPNYTYVRLDGRLGRMAGRDDQLECDPIPDAEGTDNWAPAHTHKGEQPNFIDSAKQ